MKRTQHMRGAPHGSSDREAGVTKNVRSTGLKGPLPSPIFERSPFLREFRAMHLAHTMHNAKSVFPRSEWPPTQCVAVGTILSSFSENEFFEQNSGGLRERAASDRRPGVAVRAFARNIGSVCTQKGGGLNARLTDISSSYISNDTHARSTWLASSHNLSRACIKHAMTVATIARR